MNDQPLHWSLRVAAGAAIVFLMLPVFVVVFASFSATAYLTIPPQGWTLHWFAQVLSDPTYLSRHRVQPRTRGRGDACRPAAGDSGLLCAA